MVRYVEPGWGRVMIVVFGLFLLSGCADLPVTGNEVVDARVRVESLERERVREVTALRADMAATRIAAAKKDAELAELRTAAQQLRQDNTELQQALVSLRHEREAHHAELERIRIERVQPAEAEKAAQLAALQETVASLTADMGRLRDDLAHPSPRRQVNGSSAMNGHLDRASGQQSVVSSVQPSVLREDEVRAVVIPASSLVGIDLETGSPRRVTVQLGDTLWSIARRHRVSVTELRRVNLITGDVLLAGRILTVPGAGSVRTE